MLESMLFQFPLSTCFDMQPLEFVSILETFTWHHHCEWDMPWTRWHSLEYQWQGNHFVTSSLKSKLGVVAVHVSSMSPHLAAPLCFRIQTTVPLSKSYSLSSHCHCLYGTSDARFAESEHISLWWDPAHGSCAHLCTFWKLKNNSHWWQSPQRRHTHELDFVSWAQRVKWDQWSTLVKIHWPRALFSCTHSQHLNIPDQVWLIHLFLSA